MAPVALSEFDLFSVPPTQYVIERDICTEQRPISTITSAVSPIQFEIHTAPDEYVKLGETELHMVIRIDAQKNDGKEMTAEDWKNISVANYLMHSMIKQINVTIGNEQVNSMSLNYSYKAYFEALLGLSRDAKSTYLTAALWSDDTAYKMEDIQENRSSWIKGDKSGTGRELDMMGKLHLDLAMQPRAILGGSSISITIRPSNPEFYLRHTDAYTCKVHILDASLFVHRAKVSNNIVEAHKAALRMTSAKYFITRCDVKTVTGSKGVSEVNCTNIVNGVLPRRVFIAFVSTNAYNGNHKKNPYNFHHYNANYLACFLDSEQYPQTAYQPNFAKEKYAREFYGLYEALNQNEVRTNASITRRSYCGGNTIFAFNFAPDLSEGVSMMGHLCPQKRGAMHSIIRFAEPLPETINILFYCEFDNVIEINSLRTAKKDWA